MSAWAKLTRPILGVWALTCAIGWGLGRLYPERSDIASTHLYLGAIVMLFAVVWTVLRRDDARAWIKEKSPQFYAMGSEPGEEREDFLVLGVVLVVISLFTLSDYSTVSSLKDLVLFTGACWLLPVSLNYIYMSRQIPNQESANERTR